MSLDICLEGTDGVKGAFETVTGGIGEIGVSCFELASSPDMIALIGIVHTDQSTLAVSVLHGAEGKGRHGADLGHCGR